MAINAASTFSVKERLEDLEKKVESFLDSEGLREYAKNYSEEILESSLLKSEERISLKTDQSIAKLQESMLEFETEISEIKRELQRSEAESLLKIENLSRKSTISIVLATIFLSIVQLTLAILLSNFSV
jgi:hypothetical protein